MKTIRNLIKLFKDNSDSKKRAKNYLLWNIGLGFLAAILILKVVLIFLPDIFPSLDKNSEIINTVLLSIAATLFAIISYQKWKRYKYWITKK